MFDIRETSIHLPHQQILSRDGVSFGIDAVINYKIIAPELVLYTMTNSEVMVRNVAEAALKCILGQTTFSQLMNDRKKLNASVQEYIEQRLEGTGLQVNLVETQSIELSHHLYNVMAMVVEAENRARALVIEAQGDLEGARLLAQAAENMSGNPHAVTLQAWELLENLSHTGLNTIIVPHDMLSSLKQGAVEEASAEGCLDAEEKRPLKSDNQAENSGGARQQDPGVGDPSGTEQAGPSGSAKVELKSTNPFEDDEDL